jgi:hypothetical protein
MYIEGRGLAIRTLDFVAGATPIYLDGGINIRLSNLDLQPYFSLNNLLGIIPQQYNKALPSGRYDFCFEVYDFLSGQPISRKSCFPVYLILNDPPFLNVPNRGDLVSAQNPQNSIFNWTPRHLNATNVQYEFTIKELWDTGMNPQAAFMVSPALHQETTFATTLLYGPANMQLLEGKTYGWQVRAFVNDGISETSVFRNNGLSEIYHFKYQKDCEVPSFILSKAQDSETVHITWQFSDHLRYHVQYRKKGYGDDDWFSLFAYKQEANIRNLEAGARYEFRVGGECMPQGGFTYSEIHQFTTPEEEETAYYNCGVLPEISISNQDPLLNIGVNEVFTAGDFPVTVKEVDGNNGSYSGWGFIVVPYLGDTKIRVEFKDVQINTDFQLTKGVVTTTYDPDWGGIADVDQAIDAVFGEDGEIKAYDASDLKLNDVKVDSNGKILLIDENNKPYPIDVKKPVIITDKNKDQWLVDKEGNVTKTGVSASGGVPTKNNTNGIKSNGNVTQISATDVSVLFSPSGFYATDQLEQNSSDTKFINKYERIPIASGGDYNVLYKFLSDAPEAIDKIQATATLSNGKTTDAIVFKTKEGTAVPATWSGNTATLTLKNKFKFAKEEILATVKPADSTANYDIAGKVNVWHVQQKQIQITIVPLDNAAVSSSLAKELDRIYKPVGIEFNVTIVPPLAIPQRIWDLNNNKKLDIGDSNTLANYTTEERTIYEYYKTKRTTQSQMYYIFVTDKKDIPTTDEATQGFMPLKGQYGFIFDHSTDIQRTIAHELGHGIFGLKHPFTEYNIKKGSTNLLMDYGTDNAFTHMDWQTIHAPGLQLYQYLQSDQDGEYETDGHYSTVYLASLMLGMDQEKALELAIATEAPDTSIHSEIRFELNDTWAHTDGSQQNIHSLTGGFHGIEEFFTAIKFLNPQNKNSEELGELLHRFGDTYAHTEINNLKPDAIKEAIKLKDADTTTIQKYIDAWKLEPETPLEDTVKPWIKFFNYYLKEYGTAFLENKKLQKTIFQGETLREVLKNIYLKNKSSDFIMYGRMGLTDEHFSTDGGYPDQIYLRPDWYLVYVQNLSWLLSEKFKLEPSKFNFETFKKMVHFVSQHKCSMKGIIDYEIAKRLNKKTFYIPVFYSEPTRIAAFFDATFVNNYMQIAKDVVENTKKYLVTQGISVNQIRIDEIYKYTKRQTRIIEAFKITINK